MNENLYCLVDQGAVVQGPTRLPQNYQAPDGTWYYNINNETLWPDSQLLMIGWYPYVLVDAGAPGLYPEYYDRTLSDFQIQATEVVQTAEYTQWDIERVRQEKDAEMKRQLRQYTTNERALNSKVDEYINDDAQWLANRQADLARLTVWDDVAAFDSSKPEILVLSNSYVGASYVRQGLQLTSQNSAASDSGIAPLWDQTIINNFVSTNEAAAADASNATQPLKPGYPIRQGIANVNEEFNRIVVWRFDVDDPNPSLRRSMAMQMTNRQDSRDLIAFIYRDSGATYMGFKRFVEVSPGTWKWYLSTDQNDGAIMPWVDSDIAFILSYGENPAEESKFFTDRVLFPAGVEEDNLLVAWDPA